MYTTVLPRALVYRVAPRALRVSYRSLHATHRGEPPGFANPDPETLNLEIDKALLVEKLRDMKAVGSDIVKMNTQLQGLSSQESGLRRQLTVSPVRHIPVKVRPYLANKVTINAKDQTLSCNTNGKSTKIPNIWLRDNCQCSKCVHEATRQRLLDTFDSLLDFIMLTRHHISNNVAIESHEVDKSNVHVTWNDGHRSSYSLDFFAQACADPESRSITRNGLTPLQLWDSAIKSEPPEVIYERVVRDELALKRLLQQIREYGFCYVVETPPTPETTQRLLERISFIRLTHYGGFYDFTADLASADTAYTNIALSAHTDTTYFSDPAGLQAFHLLSHTSGRGGASLLVDGFSIAHQLQTQDPEAYEILSTINVYAHASGNEGISIQPYRAFPVLEHDPSTGSLLRIRWNTSDRARIEAPMQEMEKWYDAARKWDQLVKHSQNEYWEQLTPGKVLIFDNWRVMHGRSAFTGKRRICGGYVNRDDWISRYKMLQDPKGTLERLGTD